MSVDKNGNCNLLLYVMILEKKGIVLFMEDCLGYLVFYSCEKMGFVLIDWYCIFVFKFFIFMCIKRNLKDYGYI